MEPAPLRLRMLAGAIDGALVMSPIAALVGAAERWSDNPVLGHAERLMERVGDPRVSRAIVRGGHVVALPGRNWRSPGARLVGIRTVDARTGGPVSLRSAFVAHLLGVAQGEIARAAWAPWMRRYKERAEGLRPRIQEIRRVHAGDPDAIGRAMTELRGEGGVGCLPVIAVMLATGLPVPLSALRSPRGQTIVQRWAGIVVVRERR